MEKAGAHKPQLSWPADYVDKIVQGNNIDVMRSMPEESVHCVVTSPPYWGLRDYGTPPQIWGGKPDCKHEWGDKIAGSNRGGSGTPTDKNNRGENYGRDAERGAFCVCGAWLGNLGLEPTPELYVDNLISVFCEVRRVLRDDGTLFLNLGDSFFSSASARRESVYDSHDKALEDYSASGHLCESLCGVCRVVFHRISHNDPVLVSMLRASLHGPIREHKESERVRRPTLDLEVQDARTEVSTQDCDETSSPCASRLRASLASMLGESDPRLLDECLRRASHDECLLCAHSLISGELESEGKAVCTCGITGDELDNHNIGKESLGLAYRHCTTGALKNKDLVGIPWRVAFALQADGWYLRSDIIWNKTNPMPESVTDRPTKSHEYIFLLTKSEKYFYDAEAIKENSQPSSRSRNGFSDQQEISRSGNKKRKPATEIGCPRDGVAGSVPWEGTRRNKRSVWSVATQPYPEAHFATFPPKLITPCILAGTSEKGACVKCGAPWKRTIERIETKEGEGYESRKERFGKGFTPEAPPNRTQDQVPNRYNLSNSEARTTGWESGCACKSETEPCIVLDTFGGAGTTALVAAQYDRRSVSIELNPEYCEMGRKRVAGEQSQGKLL